jgi:hypothetical protein
MATCGSDSRQACIISIRMRSGGCSGSIRYEPASNVSELTTDSERFSVSTIDLADTIDSECISKSAKVASEEEKIAIRGTARVA